ncbi:hypothetical protein [Salinispora fenicalii]|uniref:hypothetical protein n=1 Tax=Salinispora fenicalii TaxID=1137263 RepID=UPI0004B05D6B|nr:hypothetical protein [Salinispora fenicalii]
MAHSLTGISSPAGKIMMYRTAVSVPWHVAIYEPVHNGWESPDVAGTALRDRFAAESDPAGSSRVLKLRPGAVEASDINRGCLCDEYQFWFGSTRLRIDAPLGGRPSYQWPAARLTAKEKP